MIHQHMTTKRVLVSMSHAIERFADADAAEHPTIVIAMFQRLSYFTREVESYRRIAAHSALTLIGLVEDLPPALPPGVTHVLLRRDEPLAREWSVSVLSPNCGATLVAVDRETVEPDAPTVEAGRQFFGGWSFHREDAYAEVLRLRTALADRLPSQTVAAMDDVLRQVVATPARGGEGRSDAAIQHLALQLDDAGRRRGVLERERDETPSANKSEWDGFTGLRNARYLDRWVRGAAAGTLPMGILLLDVHGVGDFNRRYGTRAGVAALKNAGDTVRVHLGPADRAVSLGDGKFLALLPAASEPDLRRLHERIVDSMLRADRRFPFLPLAASAVATITRDRPLPIPSLVRAAREIRADEVAVL